MYVARRIIPTKHQLVFLSWQILHLQRSSYQQHSNSAKEVGLPHLTQVCKTSTEITTRQHQRVNAADKD